MRVEQANEEYEMNRITLSGLIAEAKAGRDTIVLSDGHNESRAAFQMGTTRDLFADAARVDRSNGKERVTFANGRSVHFLSAGIGLRGRSADVVYIDGYKAARNADTLNDARLVVASSPRGEVIRA